MIRMDRIRAGMNSTLSQLSINNIFICYLLEDKIREKKIKGQTCIPEGLYTLKFNQTAGMNQIYATKTGKQHLGMIEISGIPNFNLVFFHIGNRHQDTAGCPLTGSYYRIIGKEVEVLQSAQAYRLVYPLLSKYIQEGNAQIEVVNKIEESKHLWS